jgi:hypothetical protein
VARQLGCRATLLLSLPEDRLPAAGGSSQQATSAQPRAPSVALLPAGAAIGAAAPPPPPQPAARPRSQSTSALFASPAQQRLAAAAALARCTSPAGAFRPGGGPAARSPAPEQQPERQEPYSSEWTRAYVSRARPSEPDQPGPPPPMHACVFRASRSGYIHGLGQRPPPPPALPPPKPAAALATDGPLGAAAAAALAAAAVGAAGVDVVAGKLVVGPALPLDLDVGAPRLADHRLSCPSPDDISYILGRWNRQADEDRREARRLVAAGRGAGGTGGQLPGDGATRAAGGCELYGAASTLICK